jgi:hypothetical protein
MPKLPLWKGSSVIFNFDIYRTRTMRCLDIVELRIGTACPTVKGWRSLSVLGDTGKHLRNVVRQDPKKNQKSSSQTSQGSTTPLSEATHTTTSYSKYKTNCRRNNTRLFFSLRPLFTAKRSNRYSRVLLFLFAEQRSSP